MMGTLTAIVWCALVTASFAGWGDVVLRGLRQQRPWRFCFVVGLAFVVMVGGVLNWLHLIMASICIALVIVGAVLAAWKARRDGASLPSAWVAPRVRRWVWIVAGVVVLLLLARLLGSVHRLGYQYLDDLSEYLTFPKKMLEMHWYAADPFSERRIINSVGPAYWMQALVIAAVPLIHVQMADTSLGLLLLVVFLTAVLERWGVSVIVTGVVVALALGALQSTFNLSFTTLPSALFVAMAMVASDERVREKGWLLGALEGALMAVVVGLKGVYLPHAAIFGLVLLVVVLFREGLVVSAKATSGALLAFAAVLGPWMVAMRATSGTMLYPVLGKGFHYDAFRTMERVRSGAMGDGTVVAMFLVPLAALLLLLMLWRREGGWWLDARITALVSLVVAASVGSMLLARATGGDSPIRYNAPMLVPALLLTTALVTTAGRWRWIGFVLCLAVTVVAVEQVDHSLTYGRTHPMTEVGAYAENFRASWHTVTLPHADEREAYVAMEATMPVGSTTLTTLTTPFYFDFSKREILLAGFPGAAGPPPGWPVDGDGEALAQYLSAHGVEFLAYSYGDSANYSDATLRAAIALPNGTAVVRNEARLILSAHRQYDELAQTRKHLYDDGRMYLLDLSARQ